MIKIEEKKQVPFKENDIVTRRADLLCVKGVVKLVGIIEDVPFVKVCWDSTGFTESYLPTELRKIGTSYPKFN
jgi:hypothetical protein